MEIEQAEQVDWHPVKTRLRTDENDYLERIAREQDRSIASMLRALVREAKEREEA